MVKYLPILIACYVVLLSMKSQNIIINSSFEELIDFSKSNVSNWHKVQASDTPDYFNSRVLFKAETCSSDKKFESFQYNFRKRLIL